jgi:hypothetical protein
MELFNEYEAMTTDAQAFVVRIERALDREVDVMLSADAKGQEIETLLHSTVTSMMAEKIIRRAIKTRQDTRQAALTAAYAQKCPHGHALRFCNEQLCRDVRLRRNEEAGK